jgi:GxxExxY protein
VDLLFKEEVYKIIGAAMEVHKELGCGFLEAVYQESFELELIAQNIPYEREKSIAIYYKKRPLLKKYRADFICYDKIIVELKALSVLTSDNEAQVLNYLKASAFRVGLLINFGAKSLQYKRFIF